MFKAIARWLLKDEIEKEIGVFRLKAKNAKDYADVCLAELDEKKDLIERAEEWKLVTDNLMVDNQNRAYQVRALSQKVLRIASELRRAEGIIIGLRKGAFKETATHEPLGQELRGFSKKEIMWMIKHCHPDKHGNDEMATDVAQKLLRMR